MRLALIANGDERDYMFCRFPPPENQPLRSVHINLKPCSILQLQFLNTDEPDCQASSKAVSRSMPDTITEVELKKIRPNKLNPRLEVNLERLNELAESIREVGLLEPIIVRPVEQEFEVVVGERRYRASQQAGLERVPAIVREYTDAEVVQLNLVENVQREELSAIEKGNVCKYLLENCPQEYPDQNAVAEKIGVSAETISAWLKSAEVVPAEVRKLVAPSSISGSVPEGKIDYATALKVGRSVKEPERRVEIIKKLAEKGLPIKERAQVIQKAIQEPERSVEEVIEEVAEAPYEMQFLAHEKKLIMDGKKTQSSRITIPDPKIRAGAIVYAIVREPRFADLRIISVERKKLKYYDEEDARREGYQTMDELRKMWQETYGEWDENELVYVVHFEKLG
jgi:ParB family chromosome partitioning protein